MGPTFNSSDQPIDSLAKWMSTFHVAYALNNKNMNSPGDLEPGLMRKTSGEGLSVRKITVEMLKDNKQLAEEIHGLALHGLLGFASKDKSQIRFRQDIAKKLGNIKTIDVVKKNNKVKHLNATVGSLDNKSYSSLAGIILSSEQETTETLEKSEQQEEEFLKKTRLSTPSLTPTSKGFQILQKFANSRNKLFEGLLQQLREVERNRVKHAAELREKEAKEERQHIKTDVLKRELRTSEIKHAEIKTTEIKKTDPHLR